MERRQFLTTGSSVFGALATGRTVDLAPAQPSESYDAFLSALDEALAAEDASVIDGALCLGYGILILTTTAESPRDDAFGAELDVVADAFLDYVASTEEPPRLGVFVEVYPSEEAFEAQRDLVASYAITTAEAQAAIETGERGVYRSEVEQSVTPPIWSADDAGEPAVALREHGLVTYERDESNLFGEDSTEGVAVEALVENEGDGRSGDVELAVDWLDGDGNYLDTDSAWLQTLLPGERWLARVYPRAVDVEEVAEYEAVKVFDEPEYGTPDDVDVAESELHVGEAARMFGSIQNEGDTELSYVEVIGRVFDAEGRVLGDGWTNESDVPPGGSFRYDVRYEDEDRARLEAVTGYEVLPVGRR